MSSLSLSLSLAVFLQPWDEAKGATEILGLLLILLLLLLLLLIIRRRLLTLRLRLLRGGLISAPRRSEQSHRFLRRRTPFVLSATGSSGDSVCSTSFSSASELPSAPASSSSLAPSLATLALVRLFSIASHFVG